MRLRLVPKNPAWNFFNRSKMWMAISAALVVASIVSAFVIGMNFGIDFRGGTTIRTESTQQVDVGAYRTAIDALDLGDVSITEVFDPTFDDDQFVAMIRIQ
ncbi:MAG: protein translocase subunit SecF, partial [Paracoccaceae bacterium]|nr:protein translocase subunit SecF [Paracoccaceae bacterium]